MRPRSNISASLHKKRQASLRKKLFACFVFTLFIISLAILVLTTDNARIKNIVVSGNFSVSTEDIIRLANIELNKYYLWIIPTNNIFLLRTDEIKKDILNLNKISSVRIYTDGINKINIAIVEREVGDLWCDGDPANQKSCYFMDSDGFIFEDAPQFSVGTFPEYFGLITDNPVGKYYIKDNFKNISSLFSALKNMSFQPQYFIALTEHEYEIYVLGGGKIIVNDKSSFESDLVNLQALVDNNYIKTDEASIKKIKYIDLRFGNKVNFEMNKI